MFTQALHHIYQNVDIHNLLKQVGDDLYSKNVFMIMMVFIVNDIHYNYDVHRAQINEMCSTIISICLSASANSIPRAIPQCKIVPGWNEKSQRCTWYIKDLALDLA